MAKKDGNVTAIGDDLKRSALIVKLANQFAELKADGKSINESRKAIIDKVEANGIDRKAFKDMCREREVDEEKRIAYETSRRIIAKAFGWPEQIDWVDGERKIETTIDADTDFADDDFTAAERAELDRAVACG